MREAFIDKRFNASSRAVIDHANLILAEHEAEGYKLTLRQLFYEFVSRDLFANDERHYKRLGNIINDGRMAGVIDWEAIEDRKSGLRRIVSYDSTASFLEKTTEGYAEDLWAGQKTYCEVWIEKESLVGVIERVCFLYRVPYFACRGFASQFALYEAGKRFQSRIDQGQRVVVLYCGDHDPKGLHMSQDAEQRIRLLTGGSHRFKMVRLALNQAQIEQFGVPHNPSSENDNRTWELEALPCARINSLLVSSIADMIDVSAFQAAEEQERGNRDIMRAVVLSETDQL